MKTNKIIFLFLTLSVLFVACKPDKDDYTEKWVGNWKTMDETHFPQNKYLHTGIIIKDNDVRNQVIMSGTLLGINSLYQIPVKLSSETMGSIKFSQSFDIIGTASSNNKDTIWLNLEISKDNKSVKDTVTLIKVNK